MPGSLVWSIVCSLHDVAYVGLAQPDFGKLLAAADAFLDLLDDKVSVGQNGLRRNQRTKERLNGAQERDVAAQFLRCSRARWREDLVYPEISSFREV